MANRAGPTDWLSAEPTTDDGNVAYRLNVNVVGGSASYTGPVAAQLPASLGSKSAATSLAVTDSTEDIARMGIVTETAPATDTASSGLNGRLQRIAQRLTSLIALLPASLGAKTGAGSLSVVPASDARFVLANMQGAVAGGATYRATGTGFTGYATPTDLLTIKGSATKTVLVTGLWVQVQSTASAPFALYIVKRSTANTGGTSTQPGGVPLDSASAAATAVLDLYTAAPTTGTLVGTVLLVGAASSATASTYSAPIGLGGSPNSNALNNSPGAVDIRQNVTLRGDAESLSINWNGVAIPAGFTLTWGVEWVEF